MLEHGPFVPRGGEGSYDEFGIETPSQPFEVGDEIWFYYGGMNVHHDWWQFGEKEGLDVPEARAGWDGRQTALGLATLRREGFVSIDTNVREGVLVTRPLVSDGRRLVLNVWCGANGYLDVELADANDDVVPGFGRSAYSTRACVPGLPAFAPAMRKSIKRFCANSERLS